MNLEKILADHRMWLEDNSKGARADLRWADLRSADLSSADLSWADLRWADLRSANLSSADLSSADLRWADLSWADLSSADLRSADLRSADLSSADLDYKIISISRIGSRNGMTTFDTKNNIIWCGCFTGSIEEFELMVLETHSDNEVFRNEYLNAITFFKTFL